MRIEMRETKLLVVTINPQKGDPREIIIEPERDVRICDGEHIVKVVFKGQHIESVLVDDIYVFRKGVIFGARTVA